MIVKQTPIYLAFKYLVYVALAFNTVSFTIEAIAGAEVIYDGAPSLGQFIFAYADPIDSAAWLILLLMLELETFVIEDDVLKGPLYWGINAVNTVCYLVIIYSFYGYVGTVIDIPMSFSSFAGDACAAAGRDASVLITLDRYDPLTAQNCSSFDGTALYSATLDMFATPAAHELTRFLAWTDVVNAGVWLIIVTVLQAEVYLRSSDQFGTPFFKAYKIGKIGLYLIIIGACLVWWTRGQVLDAWDATLWILAFVFIEMNVLNWQEEIAQQNADADQAAPSISNA